jgi:hypothetical protein
LKQLLIISFILSFFANETIAQEKTCEIRLDAIKGTYTGDCVDGKADGKGKAKGTDAYEGDFKEGYPEGKGMYTWQDGHYFIGFFKKGRKEGHGDMYFESAAGNDSVITGYWKKDKYFGPYEKQFEIINNSTRISKIDCRLTDKKGDNIFVTVHQQSSGASLTSTSVIPSVSQVVPVNGTFYSINTQILTNSGVTRLQSVTFPFRAVFNLTTGDYAEILFNEKGNYDVYIDTQ